MARVTETDVAFAVLQIADRQPDDLATFYRLKREIPDVLKLTADDLRKSPSRPREKIWEQQIRNIKSHANKSPENFISRGYLVHESRRGYRITESGRRYLRRKGY